MRPMAMIWSLISFGSVLLGVIWLVALPAYGLLHLLGVLP